MKNKTKMFVVVLAVTSLTALGCGSGEFVAVSGKVTANGESVSNVLVVFTPDAIGDNVIPGPYSKGMTDENGAYTLRTRYDDAGAVPGAHKVGFEWADIDFDAMSSLGDELAEAKGDAAETAAVQKRIEDLKQSLKNRPKVDFKQVFEIEVPIEGTTGADFEIGR